MMLLPAGPPTFRVDLNMLNGNRITTALASGDASVAWRPSCVYVGAPVIVLDDEDTIADATIIAVRGGVVDLEINWATWRDRFAAEGPAWGWLNYGLGIDTPQPLSSTPPSLSPLVGH